MATNDALNNSLATQTGTGKYVGDTAPTVTDANLVTPDINDAVGDSLIITHTSVEADDLAVEIVANAAGFSGAKALDIDFITGAQTAGNEDAAIVINIDDTLATGGEVYGMEVLVTPGLATVTAMRAGALVNPLEQLAGTFADADSVLNIAVDVTAAVASGGAGAISAFVADNDTFTIGDAAKFEELSFTLGTVASGSGIAATFEFSTGSGTWASFGPTDGTNNMKNTGVIAWDNADVLTWAVGTSGDYLIRITRTRNSLGTTPIIDEVQKAAVVEYGWDKDAYITIKQALLDADPTTALEAATKQYVDNAISSGISTLTEVNQVAHGLAVEDVIKITGAGTYGKAQADSAANAEVIGVVTVVTDVDNFTFVSGGQTLEMTGLTANSIYFLDPSTAGLLTLTEPTTAGQISRPVLYTDTTTSGFYLPYRGVEVGPSPDSPPTNNAKNLIIGGNFSLNPWQRGTTFTGLASGAYSADRIKTYFVSTAVIDILKTTDAPTVAEAGIFSEHCFEVDVTTADASIAAADYAFITQRIEGYTFAQAAQRETTISFWVKSSTTGTYCVTLRNKGQDRVFIHEYTIDSSATWEKKTFTYAASPSAGTWGYDNDIGLEVIFTLMCGTDLQGTAESWQSANDIATSNQENLFASTSNYFRLTLVQFESGATATPFEIRHRETELALCQRYYQKTFTQGTTPATNTGDFTNALQYITFSAGAVISGYNWRYPVSMRALPAATYFNPSAANTKFRNVTFGADSNTPITANINEDSLFIQNSQVAADGANNRLAVHATVDAEL
jgi:hypothetical protein